MEACSEGDENQNKPLEEENKVKRKKKTPSQLEILEKAYASKWKNFIFFVCIVLGYGL